ncbi:DUF3298 and DUF4163 domain-containing protein [Paenibacillus caui]|uniref:DUF3298 and DUF4163 domain-containing protein n=1 Tax=Paenibacillus caui TaxID=2873927 RepID=UPI001CA86E69|nr:DUF3298 and DUF4163 domain-containing protein [Paenibacillus caui]
MKKAVAIAISLILLMVMVAPPHIVESASAAIKTKVYTYKGQQYIQISGGNKTATDKINKILKTHAVKAAVSNNEAKKTDKTGYFKTTASTKFNNGKILSVVYSDYLYAGGAHGMLASVSYNFDVNSGKQIKLQDIVAKEYQQFNLENALSAELAKKYAAGENVYPDSASTFKFNINQSFYYYDKGIVYRFEPYEVAPYSEGFVDIKVPFETINKETEEDPVTLPNKNNIADSIKQDPLYAETTIKGKFTGFEKGTVFELANGDKWKQISDQSTTANLTNPEVIIFPFEGDVFLVIQGQKVMPVIEKVE